MTEGTKGPRHPEPEEVPEAERYAEDYQDLDETSKPELHPSQGTPLKQDSDDVMISILDEAAQKSFDMRAIDEALNNVRGLLANAKVNILLAQAGLLQKEQDLHPEKFRQAIRSHRKALDVLVALADRAGSDEGLPDDPSTKIEVVGSLVDLGLPPDGGVA